MNSNFNSFKSRLANPFAFSMFLLAKLPAAFFAGLRLEKLLMEEAAVSVNYKWFNKNPFRSIYFAILSMAAEASTGILCMSALHKRNPSVSMLIIKMEGNFFKKATGKIIFTCADGLEIQQAVEDSISSGKSKSVVCHTAGRNKADEIIAEFQFTWSFKARKSLV